MQILIEEMGLKDTVDPLGGSYYVETLTNQMEEKIREVMAEVDRQGGIVKAIAEGHVQAAVSRQAFEQLKRVESGEVRKVGVNCYRIEEGAPNVEFHAFKAEDCEAQVSKLASVRAERDAAAVERALGRVLEDARAGRNVMPSITDAVKAYATVGEINDRLLQAYGRFREPIRF
jgi:methylmalonyl-CoA mutase N-terminal domain/subunit